MFCQVTDSSLNTSSGLFTISVVDTTPPETTILSSIDGISESVLNGGTTSSNSMTFTFTGLDNVSVEGFQCSLDGSSFASCTSPVTYTGLAEGPHVFGVRGIDSATNADPTPATFSWSVTLDLTTEEKTQNIIDQVQDLVNKNIEAGSRQLAYCKTQCSNNEY